ncbi:MAG TPA: CopD family protein [Myxococcota bacterium]|nr:CopD family protein [Myxococcota bacterium]
MAWIRLVHLLGVILWTGAFSTVGALGRQACDAKEPPARDALVKAAVRTNAFSLAGLALALAGGLVMFFTYLQTNHYLKQPWMHGKLTCVAVLIALHVAMTLKLAKHARTGATAGAGLYRAANAAGGPLALLVLFFVIIRPWERLF